jgi:hypothetical protein
MMIPISYAELWLIVGCSTMLGGAMGAAAMYFAIKDKLRQIIFSVLADVAPRPPLSPKTRE